MKPILIWVSQEWVSQPVGQAKWMRKVLKYILTGERRSQTDLNSAFCSSVNNAYISATTPQTSPTIKWSGEVFIHHCLCSFPLQFADPLWSGSCPQSQPCISQQRAASRHCGYRGTETWISGVLEHPQELPSGGTESHSRQLLSAGLRLVRCETSCRPRAHWRSPADWLFWHARARGVSLVIGGGSR